MLISNLDDWLLANQAKDKAGNEGNGQGRGGGKRENGQAEDQWTENVLDRDEELTGDRNYASSHFKMSA